MNKQRMVVEWSPHDPSLFAVGADNLRLYETTATDVDGPTSSYGGRGGGDAPATTTQRKRSFRLIKINASVHAQNAQLKCMEWYPFDAKPLWIASGLGNGKVILSDFQDPRSRVVREFSPKYTRPCNAVAWNHAAPNQLAAGFEKVRSDYCTLVWDLNLASSGSTIMGSVGGGLSQTDPGMPGGLALVGSHMDALGSHDDLPGGGPTGGGPGSLGLSVGSAGLRGNSFSRVGSVSSMVGPGSGTTTSGNANGANGTGTGGGDLMDKPVHELSNSEATVALSWVPLQPACLAVGTGFKWLRIYDLRAATVPASASGSLSVVAHNKAVLGVVFDRHRPHILATYTDGPQEAIKIWDIRRLDTSMGPLVSLHHSSKTLAQVSWCPTKPGILATASVEERYLSLWDVSKQDKDAATATTTPTTAAGFHIKKPFKRRYTSEPLASFSWQCVNYTSSSVMRSSRSHQLDGLNAQLAAAAFPNRLLTASVSGEIEDISVHDSLPISVSPLGSLAFSCGRLLFGGAATGDRKAAPQELDIALEMQRLAKARYSMIVDRNLRLFATAATGPLTGTARQRELRSVWQWVDQVEALRRLQVARLAHARNVALQGGSAPVSPLRGWPVDPAALTMVGIKNLLALAEDSPGELASLLAQQPPPPLTTIPSMLKTDPVLGCSYYEGFGRRLALLACHWDPDCGRSSAAASASDGGSLPPRQQGGLALHRSSSGAWTSQRQFEDATAFGHRGSEPSRHELRALLQKCESESHYARAAALAVFHGDLTAAVAVLQKGAMWLNQLPSHLHARPYTADVLQLVAMAVAGYSTAAASPGMPNMWASMCQQLLRRQEITAQHHPRYLHALLSFLCATAASSTSSSGSLRDGGIVRASPAATRRVASSSSSTIRKSWGSVDGLAALGSSGSASRHASITTSGVYAPILNDATLPLSDRVAFACRFLPPEDLRVFVMLHMDECQQHGRLDGLLLTGVSPTHGVQLLQRYLDKTGDIQTLALLAARLPSVGVAKTAPVLEQWITIYQDLLNQWQLFHERARLDVARAQHEDALHNLASFVKDTDAATDDVNAQPPAALSVPPQLFVRCNYCNTSLSLANLLRLGGSHSSWLNRAKPKLTCCPSCRKPLPQCALCLLPLGALNPYLELAHRRSKQTADAVSSMLSMASTSGGDAIVDDPGAAGKSGETAHESLAQLSSIPFVEWFTWCQSCKHGGHAHHVADWFAAHAVCPVTDCGCKCQLMDLPIAQQKRQEEGRLLQEEQQHEQDERRVHQQTLLEQEERQNEMTVPAVSPRTSPRPSRQDNPLGLKRRGSRSQQQAQLQQAQASFFPGVAGNGGGGGGAAGLPSSVMGVLPSRMPPSSASRMGTPLVGAATAGELGAAMNSMTLSNKLDQLDKEKGTKFFL
jgi:WD repeat-containing protein mio